MTTIEEPDLEFDDALQPAGASDRTKLLLGGLLAIAVGLLMSTLAMAHITQEEAAKRSLAEGIAILTEVDALLDAEYEDLRERAGATSDQVALTEFPIRVLFTPEEVLATNQASFRELLLQRSADRLYDDGASTLREGRASEANIFSIEGMLRLGMDILRPTPHRVFLGLTFALAAVAACLAFALALATRGFGRIVAISLAVFLAAAPFLAASVALRFAIRVAADGTDDYLAHEFFTLGQELAWAPIRDGMIFAVASIVALVTGIALARLRDSGNL